MTCDEAAANKTYIGCDFWPTVTDNIVFQTFDFAVAVANTGDVPADVHGGAQRREGGEREGPGQRPWDGYLPWVPELRSAVSPLGVCIPMSPLTNTVAAKGGAYHLVSSRPVTVYQFNAIEYQGVGGPAGEDWSQCPGTTCGPIYPGCFSVHQRRFAPAPEHGDDWQLPHHRANGLGRHARSRNHPEPKPTSQDRTSSSPARPTGPA